MPIRVICPSCGRIGKAPDQALGRTARCPECKHLHVLTDDLVHSEDDLDLAPGPKGRGADPLYGLASGPTLPPRSATARPGVGPGAVGGRDPNGSESSSLPVPALVGGGVGLVLISVLIGWGFGSSRGREPADQAVPTLAAQINAPAATEVEPAPAGSTVGADSVAAVPALDPPPPAELPTAGPEGTPVVAAKPRAEVSANDSVQSKTLSTAEIVEESEPSVALIKGKGSSGTAFLVAPGLIATNSHVIDDEFASDLEVRFVSADEAHSEPIHPTLLYEDAQRDLAILSVPTDLKPLRVARSYTFRKGEDITVIGNPGMGDGQVLENAISRGVMSTKAKIDEKNFYQINIAINPGNSGGPVFDSAGRVIGVATLKSAKQEATGFSIPIEDLQAAIARVGTQPPTDVEKHRSRHRTTIAVKTLGSGGAILCLLIDLRKADQAKNPAVKEVLGRVEAVAELLEKELIPTLNAESQLARKDPFLAPAVRTMVGEIADNFAKVRSLVTTRNGVDDGALHNLKQNHRRLVTGLASALKIEFPKDMMIAFEDHNPAQPTIIAMSPPDLGSRLRSRSANLNPSGPSRGTSRMPSARERMLQRRNGGR